MVAVDTNVVVRLLTADDPRETAAARSLFAAGPVWIAKTVLLETAWVLGALYGIEESAVREAFLKLLALENVQVEDAPAVTAALDLVPRGIDFADAMHLSSRPPAAGFASFDRTFVRRAQRAGAAGVMVLSGK